MIRTQALIGLKKRSGGRELASAQHPWALFTYQTLSAGTYAAFLERYVKSKESWAPRDFGKPGVERFGAIDREWHPRVTGCWTASSSTEDRVVLEMSIDDPAALAGGAVAWPAQIFLDLRCPAARPAIELELTTLRKQANRMPEAMWLTFQPQTRAVPLFEKAGEPVRADDVVRGGGRAMHAAAGLVHYADTRGPLSFESLDTALIAVGRRSPLNFSLDPPAFTQGLHYGLFNNAWGTNYPQWSGGSWAYRFHLQL